MVSVLYKPMNRAEKRRFEREVDELVEKLFAIENNFMRDLFHPAYDDKDYQTLYAFHLEQYLIMAKWLKRYGKFKFTAPDLDYFHNEFKPREI
jgi:hypothetical protein